MKKVTYYEVDWEHEGKEGTVTLHYMSTSDLPGGTYRIDGVNADELTLLTTLLRKHPKVVLNPETGHIFFDKNKVDDD